MLFFVQLVAIYCNPAVLWPSV